MREMIVGREHLVGAHHRDYDELMEMGAASAPAPQAPPPQATHPVHALPPAPHPHSMVQHPGQPSPPPSYAMPHGAYPPPSPVHHPHYPHHLHPHHPHHHAPPPPAHYDADEHHHGDHHGGRRMRVVREEPRNQRQFPIGFEATSVAPGAEEDIEVKPQVLFRGERLAIAQSIARYFDVIDIKVGKDSQLAATGALTGEAFETRAVGVRMELDTAQPGIVITLRVRNIDTAAHDFRAVLYGAVLE
jgi:hypothetical protein